MGSSQQSLLMVGEEGFVPPPIPTCVPDPYYSCGPDGDPYWDNVVLMLHFDGTNGSTTFTDSSLSAQVSSPTGAASLSIAQTKFGPTALGLTGASTVNVAQTADLRFLSVDFTIEGWFYFTSVGGSTNVLTMRNFNSLNGGFALQYNGGGWQFQFTGTDQAPSSLTSLLFGSAAPPQNQWLHVAFVKSGVVFRLFVGGQQVGNSYTYSAQPREEATGAPLTIGGPLENNAFMTGFVDDLRITKGIARYTGPFNIPAEAFPDFEGDVGYFDLPRTVLSLHTDEAPPIDSSCYQPKTLALTGTAAVQSSVAKFSSAVEVLNDGTSTLNGFTVADHQDFDFGTGDFTIECWAYRLANTYEGYLYYAAMGGEFSFRVLTTGLIRIDYRVNGSTVQTRTTAVSFPLNQWNFVVIQRRGLNFEFYLNGTLMDITAVFGGATSTVNSTGTWFWGRMNASSATSWNGYIDEVRVTRGAARYEATYTIPTAAFPDDPADFPLGGTLLHFDGAQDSTTFTESSPTSRTYSATGAAKLDQASLRFGTASLLLDGASSWVSTTGALTDFAFGTGDFTVECWVKTSAAKPQVLIDFYQTGNTGCWQLYLDETGFFGTSTLAWWSSDALGVKVVGSNFNPRDGLWHHVAVCRFSGVTTIYADGIVQGLAIDTRNYSGGVPAFAVGAQITSRNAAYDFEGSIDEVRIIKGVARYTTDFDPASLPNCDSANDPGGRPVSGTAYLQGESATVAIGDTTVQDPWAALSSPTLTATPGNLIGGSPDRAAALTGQPATITPGTATFFTPDRTASLVSATATTTAGTVTRAPYPGLTSGSASLSTVVPAATRAYLAVSFSLDGTLTLSMHYSDGEVFGTPIVTQWIDKTNTNFTISSIATLYELFSFSNFGGITPFVSEVAPGGGIDTLFSAGLPLNLGADKYVYFVTPNIPPGSPRNFSINCQIVWAGTPSNPDYSGTYYGIFRLTGFIGVGGL